MMISFVIANFGFKPFVLECLRSLLNASCREDAEVIVVDDGTPEADWCRLRSEIAAQGLRVERFVRLTSNQGFGAAMNAGILEARGELIVALNSDCVVGREVIVRLKQELPELERTVGFLALPIYDWKFTPQRSELTADICADAVCLTAYISCVPAAIDRIRPKFVLGPGGPAVVMTRCLVNRLQEGFGAVYDPSFFMYGEDVDLYLRSRRLGFATKHIAGNWQMGEVIWHIGAGSQGSDNKPRTVERPPQIARLYLSNCWRNSLVHAGLMELPIIVAGQILFSLYFYFAYARQHSPGRLRELCQAPLPQRTAPLPRLPRPRGFFLLRTMAVLHQRLLPWARRT